MTDKRRAWFRAGGWCSHPGNQSSALVCNQMLNSFLFQSMAGKTMIILMCWFRHRIRKRKNNDCLEWLRSLLFENSKYLPSHFHIKADLIKNKKRNKLDNFRIWLLETNSAIIVNECFILFIATIYPFSADGRLTLTRQTQDMQGLSVILG